MADAIVVSNYFLDLAQGKGRTLTPMQAIKLVYIAHGVSLGLLNRGLIHNRIEAWKYGPVIPDLYNVLRYKRNNPIEKIVDTNLVAMNDEDRVLVESVYTFYQDHDGLDLSSLTHKEGTPWSTVYAKYVQDGQSQTITDALVQSYYKELLGRGGDKRGY